MNTFEIALLKNIQEDKSFYVEIANNYTSVEPWKQNRVSKFIASKNFSSYTAEKKTAYLLKRITLYFDKEVKSKMNRLSAIENSADIKEINISVEWKKSRTWGANPTATARIDFIGGRREVFTASASGCGYDKESAAIASALNQCNSFIKLLFEVESKDPESKVYGYSNSKKGFFPSLSGGVGVSCYPAVFALAGFEWKKTGWGKTFDCYQITKH